uniref:Uncharacterized protein n=1 Tax=Anopheles culicifacies TaxID=139723 RepID=A0A182MNZ6_9DIPT
MSPSVYPPGHTLRLDRVTLTAVSTGPEVNRYPAAPGRMGVERKREEKKIRSYLMPPGTTSIRSGEAKNANYPIKTFTIRLQQHCRNGPLTSYDLPTYHVLVDDIDRTVWWRYITLNGLA